MRKFLPAISFFLFTITLLAEDACAAKPEEKTIVVSSPLSSLDTKAPIESDWDKKVINAKKEGKVIILGSPGIASSRDAFIKGINDSYGISADILVGRGPELTAKIQAERRAGIYEYDVYIGGIETIVGTLIPQKILDPIQPLLMLTEVKEPNAWRGNNLPLFDRGGIAFASLISETGAIAFNTSMVKPEEIDLFEGLLLPKLEGKIGLQDPTTPGSGQSWFYNAYEAKGEDYLRAIAKQKPFITRDNRLLVDGLAKGRFAVILGISTDDLVPAYNAGAPVSMLGATKEANLYGGDAGYVCAVTNPSHPNSQILFINWILSKNGQTAWSRASGHPSRRMDVTTEYVAPWLRKALEGKIIFDTEERTNQKNALTPKFQEILAPLMK